MMILKEMVNYKSWHACRRGCICNCSALRGNIMIETYIDKTNKETKSTMPDMMVGNI